MIRVTKLQLLLCVLGISYAFAENESYNIQKNRSIIGDNVLLKIPALKSPEYTTTTKVNSYREQDRKTEIQFTSCTTQQYADNDFAVIDYPISSENQESFELNFTETLIETSGFSDDFPIDSVNDDSIPLVECTLFSSNNIEELKEVQNLTTRAVGTEWIFLTWLPPCYNADNTSFLYSITICTPTLREDCIKVNASDNKYNATDLEPCTQYAFTVKIIYEDGESNGVDIDVATSGKISEIGDVQNLHAYNVTADAILLTWESPVMNPNCVRYYLVRHCRKENCTKAIVKDTEHLVENLEACIEYTFIVVAVAEKVESSGVVLNGKISSPKLSEPQLATAEPGNFSLFVHWRPPAKGAPCVKHYSVTINPNSTTKITNDTNIVIDNLFACSTYNISITAVNEEGYNGNTVTIEQQVAPVVTKSPILEDTEPVAFVDTISFSWGIEKEFSHCPLSSITTQCNYTVTNGHGFEVVNGTSTTTIDASVSDEYVIVNTTVEKISPYTTYTCWAYVTNIAGSSELSESVNVTTLEDVPSAPEFRVENITDSQFVVTWDVPKYLAGTLSFFEIVLEWDILFLIPDWCVEKHDSPVRTIYVNDTTFLYEYTDAIPFTNYVVKIRANTSAGWGNYSELLSFVSAPGVPGVVSNFSYRIAENKNNSNFLNTYLSWTLPCSLNGMLEYFEVSVNGVRKNYAPHFFSFRKDVAANVERNNVFLLNLEELKGEYTYSFAVATKVSQVDILGQPAYQTNILYPAGIPPQPSEEYIKSITIDPYKARRSTTSAAVLLPLFPDSNGDIICYSIIVSELGKNPKLSIRHNLNGSWPNVSSWEEAMLEDFSIPYQATRPRWNPYPNYVADYGHMKAVKYVIGDDATCKEISSNTEKRLYCNGPLKPDTWYHVRMRAFTYGGYTDSEIFTVKTNAELNVAIVIGIVFGILFLGILTTMLLLVRKWSPIVILRRFLHSDMPGSPVPTPFTRKKFIAHCQQLVDNPGKLSNEFRLLQTLSVDLQMPTNSACLQANRKKNRYSDILPYDFSRVKLEAIDNDPNTDYINASFIRGYTGEDEYIACQGPKEDTTYDFWRMVDQYNANIIVMLTQLVEKGKEKCHQYFPTIRETFRYENMTIRCTSELDFRTYTQRALVLQKDSKKRNILHLHFKDWPDHDVPEDFDAIINFCQIMRRHIIANKGFVVIHCSAGIGRTGTLIAIDILLQHLRDNRKLDVFGTVYRLRHHRINMVQRETQYAYIYNCIKQVLKNPYCLKTYKPPPVHPVHEGSSKKEKTSNVTTIPVDSS